MHLVSILIQDMSDASSESRAAVGALYLDHHSWLLTRLRRRVRSHADAEDLTADTFVELIKARVDPLSLNEPRAFLTTIAQRLLYRFQRRSVLEQAYLERLAALPQALAPSPEDQALVLESIVALDRALSSLCTEAKTAFLCHQLDGMSHDEIAACLNVSVRTVGRYMQQAMACCYLLELD